jgi:hypothetical protein
MKRSRCWIMIAVGLLAGMGMGAGRGEREIRDGRLFVDGEWEFLKIAKPLRHFGNERQVERLIADLAVLQEKHFNAVSINCYWHHFDHTGDGSIDVSTEPLRRLIDAIHERGMFPILSVETYGVGGGQVPAGFWERHPEAVAINSLGEAVKDDEYGFGLAVPSLYYGPYLEASRAFIRNITASVDHSKVLYFETTVEPQYMGKHALCYSDHARREYEAWLRVNQIEGPAWPEGFAVPEGFVADAVWNRFRAEWLAEWVNEDAAVFRGVAGEGAYVAVDYLETCGEEMRNRNGDSRTFLRALTSANIIQVNWHWHVSKRSPNQCAYDNVRLVMREMGREWAITEHMTINGSDYRVDDMEPLLLNTIEQGTGFGWEFTNVAASAEAFSVYDEAWRPKAQMAVVDEQWERWQEAVRAKLERTAEQE